jgi:hypothetical protein
MNLKQLRRELDRRVIVRRLRRNGYSDIEIKSFRGTAKSIDFIAKHQIFAVLADSMAGMFDDVGGLNFVDSRWTTSDGRVFSLIVAPREPGILSPGEVVEKLRHACLLAFAWFTSENKSEEFTRDVCAELAAIAEMYSKGD